MAPCWKTFGGSFRFSRRLGFDQRCFDHGQPNDIPHYPAYRHFFDGKICGQGITIASHNWRWDATRHFVKLPLLQKPTNESSEFASTKICACLKGKLHNVAEKLNSMLLRELSCNRRLVQKKQIS
jgi:hypothetical protein